MAPKAFLVLALAMATATGVAAAGCGAGGSSSGRSRPPAPSEAPQSNALDHSIRPAKSIGPIELNEPRSRVEHQLGPGQPDATDPTFVAWPARGGELAVTFDAHERVVTVRANTPVFTYRGLSVADGLGALRRSLPDWKFLACGPSKGLTLNEGPNGPSTTFAFYDGPPIHYTREVGFPIVQISVYPSASVCVG